MNAKFPYQFIFAHTLITSTFSFTSHREAIVLFVFDDWQRLMFYVELFNIFYVYARSPFADKSTQRQMRTGLVFGNLHTHSMPKFRTFVSHVINIIHRKEYPNYVRRHFPNLNPFFSISLSSSCQKWLFLYMTDGCEVWACAEKIRVQKLICFFFFSWAKISYKVVVDIPFLVVEKAAIQRLSTHILSRTHSHSLGVCSGPATMLFAKKD